MNLGKYPKINRRVKETPIRWLLESDITQEPKIENLGNEH